MPAPSWTSRTVGFFDRGGFDATTKTYQNWNGSTTVTAQYNAVLGGVVMHGGDIGGGITWREMQTSAGSPAGTHALDPAGVAYIDAMFQQADNYNATNPTLSGFPSVPLFWTIKVRIFTGEYAPTWAQALNGGPLVLAGAPNCGCWWASAYVTAYQNFLAKLAAYVPQYTIANTTSSGGLAAGANTQPLAGHPLLGAVTNSQSMTKFAEVMMKDDWNTKGAYSIITGSGLTVPYSYSVDTAAFAASIAYIQSVFPNNPHPTSHNPYLKLNPGTVNQAPTAKTSTQQEAQTETFMDDLAGLATAPNPVTDTCPEIENNSLGFNGTTYPPVGGGNPSAYVDGNGSGYTAMYTHMASYNRLAQANVDLGFGGNLPTGITHDTPICFQTSTYGKMGGTPTSLLNTIDYAAWLGARMVELPGDSGGYQNLTPSQLAAKYAALLANDPGPSSGGGGGTFPPSDLRSRRRWRSFAHH